MTKKISFHYDDYVVIIPFKEDTVMIQRQYKPGVKKKCYGFPAGFKKRNETPLNAAKRELFEETRYKADNWISLGTYYDNVSITSARFTIFLATNLEVIGNESNQDKRESKIENIPTKLNYLDSIMMEGACMALARALFLKYKIERT